MLQIHLVVNYLNKKEGKHVISVRKMDNIRELINYYTLNVEEIESSEQRMGCLFPTELKEFFLKIGYGFVKNNIGAINRLIDPETCADIRLRDDFYEYDPDLELYESYEKEKMIFFEVNEGVYLLMGLDDNAIYYLDERIADNLSDFIIKISNNPDYWCK